MEDVVGLLEIVKIYHHNILNKNKFPLEQPQEEPFPEDILPEEDPNIEKVPPEIDPQKPSSVEKEPPLTPEEKVDPSKNPMKAEKEELWMTILS